MNKEGASNISTGRYRKGDCYEEDKETGKWYKQMKESFGLPKYRLPVGKDMMSISCRWKALSARFKEYWLLSYRK